MPAVGPAVYELKCSLYLCPLLFCVLAVVEGLSPPLAILLIMAVFLGIYG